MGTVSVGKFSIGFVDGGQPSVGEDCFVTGLLIAAWGTSVAVLLGLLLTVRRQLFLSRASFDALSHQAPVGVFRTDAQGQCNFANDTWCQISGLSVAETLGLGWTHAVHPEDVSRVAAKWEECVRSRKAYLNEIRLVRPDGTLRHVLTTGRPTHDKQGRLKGFIGTVLDVTERLAAEQQAREKESLLQALVDNSSAAIYLKDASGQYLLINRRHMELWPVMKDFRAGTTPYDWFPEEVARSFIASDNEVFASGQTKTFEETVSAADGLRTYLTIKFPVFDGSQQVVAVGGISADITELEQARQTLVEREHLLRSLIDVQEKEKQFLCHEFHDGLIQYAVGSKMLLEGIRDRGIPNGFAESVASVIDCLSKGIEEGRRVIRGIRPAVLDDLGLGAAIEDLVSELQETGIAVGCELDPTIEAIPPPLQTTVYRVVQESLNNARKHSGSRRVSLTVCRVAKQLVVTVEDFGCGFDRAKTRGGGFGLVSMRERSRLLGGDCIIESTLGQGTKVIIKLPLVENMEGDRLAMGETSPIAGSYDVRE